MSTHWARAFASPRSSQGSLLGLGLGKLFELVLEPLLLDEPRVDAFMSDQLVVRALFDDVSLFEHNDVIAACCGRDAVRDEDHAALALFLLLPQGRVEDNRDMSLGPRL